MSIGEKIKELRKNNKLTQEAFAEKLMVSRRTVIDWENDKYHPQTDLLIKISEVFNIPLSELTNTVEDVKPIINDIKGDFVCLDKNIYKDEKKRLKGKYKNKINTGDKIGLIVLPIVIIILTTLGTIMDEIELFLMVLLVFITLAVVCIRIIKNIKYNDLINRYEYYKNNNKDCICLSPYLEVVAKINDRLVISYNKNKIIDISMNDIMDIRLYKDSTYYPSYYPNDYDNKTYIYGMHIVYNDNTISKIAFAVIDNKNAAIIRKIMNDSFNMLKSSTKKGV